MRVSSVGQLTEVLVFVSCPQKKLTVTGVIMSLYLFACVRKWQCNDLKSKQRMRLCVDQLLHLANLAPLPFAQSWLVGIRPMRGQGN